MYYLQSRYYDPKLGRFINADTFVSTGQGIIGNNMFSYCGNNPVCLSDPTGMFFIGWGSLPGQEAGEAIAEWLIALTASDKKTIEDGEVTYESNGAGEGAHIANSHKVKTPWAMFQFVEENRSSEIVGSTTGVVFEWMVHNIAYEIGDALGIDRLSIPAKNLDVGKTIYDDSRPLFTPEWVMSECMKEVYGFVLPGFACIDYVEEIWWDYCNG